MKLIPMLLLAIVLACPALQSIAQEVSAPTVVNTGYDRVAMTLPPGFYLDYSQSAPGQDLMEYVPVGQTVDHWTDMITVMVIDRRVVANRDRLIAGMIEQFPRGCAVKAVMGQPEYFTEGSYPVAVHYSACANTRKFGSAELVIYKVFEASSALFMVQRSWRLPNSDTAKDLPFSGKLVTALIDSGKDFLATVYVCDIRREACGPDSR